MAFRSISGGDITGCVLPSRQGTSGSPCGLGTAIPAGPSRLAKTTTVQCHAVTKMIALRRIGAAAPCHLKKMYSTTSTTAGTPSIQPTKYLPMTVT